MLHTRLYYTLPTWTWGAAQISGKYYSTSTACISSLECTGKLFVSKELTSWTCICAKTQNLFHLYLDCAIQPPSVTYWMYPSAIITSASTEISNYDLSFDFSKYMITRGWYLFHILYCLAIGCEAISVSATAASSIEHHSEVYAASIFRFTNSLGIYRSGSSSDDRSSLEPIKNWKVTKKSKNNESLCLKHIFSTLISPCSEYALDLQCSEWDDWEFQEAIKYP